MAGVPVDVAVNVNVTGFAEVAERLKTSLSTIDDVTSVLQDHGRIAMRRAVANVSGIVRTFEGKPFVVHRKTGKLAGSIQVVELNALSVSIQASADYASFVEQGTRGPTDLKKSRLAGKVVPLPFADTARAKALTVQDLKTGKRVANTDIHTMFVGRLKTKQTSTSGLVGTAQKASTGTAAGYKYIVFRRVPKRGGEGWIIPQRAAAPFLEEAAAYTAPLLKDAIEKAFAHFIESGQ